jgi:hypothetical protein
MTSHFWTSASSVRETDNHVKMKRDISHNDNADKDQRMRVKIASDSTGHDIVLVSTGTQHETILLWSDRENDKIRPQYIVTGQDLDQSHSTNRAWLRKPAFIQRTSSAPTCSCMGQLLVSARRAAELRNRQQHIDSGRTRVSRFESHS